MIRVVETEEFSQEVEQGIVVVDFFATWCPPCKMLEPVLNELSTEMTQAKFIKVDIDQSTKLAQKHRVTSVPTVMIFKDGQAVDSLIGFNPKESITKKISQHI